MQRQHDAGQPRPAQASVCHRAGLADACTASAACAGRVSSPARVRCRSTGRTWFQATSMASASSKALKTVLKEPRPSTESVCGTAGAQLSQRVCASACRAQPARGAATSARASPRSKPLAAPAHAAVHASSDAALQPGCASWGSVAATSGVRGQARPGLVCTAKPASTGCNTAGLVWPQKAPLANPPRGRPVRSGSSKPGSTAGRAAGAEAGHSRGSTSRWGPPPRCRPEGRPPRRPSRCARQPALVPQPTQSTGQAQQAVG